MVFTLQSIKSRIEPQILLMQLNHSVMFLLYSPLNQGLKLKPEYIPELEALGFLLYSPLNQGLKHETN